MQAGPPPEDLHAILSRFHNWSGKGPANGNGHAKSAPEEGIREIPYEEAIRQHRNRQAGRSGRRTATQKGKAAAETSQPAAKPAEPSSPNLSESQEDMPLWVANLPVVPETEPVMELKAQAPAAQEWTASPAAPDPPTAPRRGAKPSPTERATVTKPPKIESSEQVFLAAFPELPASRFVDLPAVPLTQRSKPRRRVAPPPPPAPKQPVAAVQASALKPASAAIAAPPSPKPKPHANPVKASAPAIAAKPVARPTVPTGLIGSPIKALPASPARPPVVKKAAPASAAKSKSRTPRRPPFRQVLARTIQQPKAALALRDEPARDRTRRITTRFSPGEERRIGKCAAELGITVSTYLRRCALSAVTQKAIPESPAPPASAKPRKPPARNPEHPVSNAAPAPLLGGWLTLLRNRFLGPPVRFSEEA